MVTSRVDFLKARHAAMSAHHFFADLEFTTDPATIHSWAPLLTEARPDVPIAVTKMATGTDVNFGEISRKLLSWLGHQSGCGIASGHRVTGLAKTDAGWDVTVKNLATGETFQINAKFVLSVQVVAVSRCFKKRVSLKPRGSVAFPSAGNGWFVITLKSLPDHQAKVYGQALDAAPTMAVPHLDTRILDGKKTLLFGPFAAWTTKFLHKKGSYLDLPLSVKPDNLATLLKIGIHNLDLVKYLVQQGTQSIADRMKVLHVFYPAAEAKDWKLIDAGIRVQAIKKTDGEAGIVHYGTEVITNEDHSISALLALRPEPRFVSTSRSNLSAIVFRICSPPRKGAPVCRRWSPSGTSISNSRKTKHAIVNTASRPTRPCNCHNSSAGGRMAQSWPSRH